jgi:hypothetical protein
MTIPPVLPVALDQFLEEWRDALEEMTDDEARDFVLTVKQRMTLVALKREGRNATT